MKLKQEKGLYFFTLMLFILYFLSGAFLTSCGAKEAAEQNEDKEPVSAGELSGNRETSKGVLPEPASAFETSWGGDIYYSDITYEAVEDYLRILQDNGWINVEVIPGLFDGSSGISPDEPFAYLYNSPSGLPEGITGLILSDGKDLLQLVITIESKESPMGNSILVRLEKGVSGEMAAGRKDALTIQEALALIQPEVDRLVDNNEISAGRQKIIGLFEIFIEDAYEKMGLQAYAAISNSGVTGSFLICNGQVLHVMGYLEEACVADLDGNGRYELLDLFGFGSGIYRIELSAYEYGRPVYVSSYAEVLHQKYSNCLIPDQGYGELAFYKISDSEVRLIGNETDYGKLVIEDLYLVPENLEDFPFRQWKDVFDQSRLPEIDKRIPEEVPDIVISVDGRSLDYVTKATKWDGITEDYNTVRIAREIMDQGNFVPTYGLGFGMDAGYFIEMDFGDYIPDTIQVKDAILEDNGNIRYGSKLVMDREVEILDDRQAGFGLVQHMAYMLSSYSGDYMRDWYRIFHVICTWGEKEAVYTFIINTGKEEKVTEITDHDFLVPGGNYSMLSSSWGVGLQINTKSGELPEQFMIEWQVSGGEIRTWREEYRKPFEIADKHHGHPMTSSFDANGGAVIWHPTTYENGERAHIKAFLYRNAGDKSPAAVSEITLICENGNWKEKPE